MLFSLRYLLFLLRITVTSMHVCLFICSSVAYISQKSHGWRGPNFLCALPVSRCDMLCIHCESKKNKILYCCPLLCQMLTDFQISFTGGHTSKFAIKSIIKQWNVLVSRARVYGRKRRTVLYCRRHWIQASFPSFRYVAAAWLWMRNGNIAGRNIYDADEPAREANSGSRLNDCGTGWEWRNEIGRPDSRGITSPDRRHPTLDRRQRRADWLTIKTASFISSHLIWPHPN